jgi:hypothetical protein
MASGDFRRRTPEQLPSFVRLVSAIVVVCWPIVDWLVFPALLVILFVVYWRQIVVGCLF